MYYALSIRKTRGTKDVSDYEAYIATMLYKNKSVVNMGHYYEYTEGLHVHMLLYKHGQGTLSHNDCKVVKYGWHVYLEPVYNLQGWKRYITKDQSRSERGPSLPGEQSPEDDTHSCASSGSIEYIENVNLMKRLKTVRIV